MIKQLQEYTSCDEISHEKENNIFNNGKINVKYERLSGIFHQRILSNFWEKIYLSKY